MNNTIFTTLLLNKTDPMIMHIDLNSCFAIIEQQANRLLRGKPVGIAAYDTPRGFVLAASYEAKAQGIALGVNVEQSRALCPGIVIMTPDPSKYREAHKRFKALLLEYTPDVVPKSIDEFVLDFTKSSALRERIAKTEFMEKKNRDVLRTGADTVHNNVMLELATEIKQKIAERLGEWVTVNVGIAPNRFLAKYGAGFDKPDGMRLIDHTNIQMQYEGMNLIDLPGINVRYRRRLREAGIYTPTDFFNADMNKLKKQVFKSINGYHWYRRLRGFEADAVEFSRKSIGHQHALKHQAVDMPLLERLLMKLCEKTGRRLRKNNYYATGIHLYIGFTAQPQTLHEHTLQGGGEQHSVAYREYGKRAAQSTTQQSSSNIGRSSGFAGNAHDVMYGMRSWSHGEKVYHRLYSTQDIYKAAKRLLHSAEISNRVKIMSVHVFGLEPWDPEQLSIFDIPATDETVRLDRTHFSSVTAQKRLSDAVDIINNRYGEFVVTPALMIEMQGEILDRIAFGQVRDM